MRFLLKLVAAVLLAFLLWFLQITVSVGTGLILPANAAEKEALAYLHTIGAHTDIVSSGIPSACGYAIYDASGELLETDMSGSIRENADLLALSGQDSLSANMLGRTYVKRQTDTRIVVLTYDFRSAFANPALRRLFPSAELLEVFLLLFLLLVAFVLVITRQAKIPVAGTFSSAGSCRRNPQSESRLYHPGDCHLRIQPGSRFSGRAETELSASLKEQWHMQQQRRRQFSALAHDIKTPLTIVRGNGGFYPRQRSMRRSNLATGLFWKTPHRSRIIWLELSSSQRRMIRCMFRGRVPFSGAASHGIVFSTICSGIQKSLGQKKELHVLFSTETLPAVLPLPEHPLRRILNNLLDNAVCYSPHKGTVTLDASIRDYRDASEKESTLFLTVSDEGPGFCEDALLYGTEAFYRESADRNDKSHFGLGLSIADQLARGLGGSITLCNAPAGGAVVIVRLPLTGQLQRDTE